MMLRPAAMVLGSAAIVLGASGCPLLAVDVETEEVCLTYPGLEVPGVTAGGALHEELVFDDVASLDGLDQVDGDVEFTRVTLRATAGISDFGFLTSARVAVAPGDPDAALPETTVVDCSGDGCARDGAELTAYAADTVDAVPYLRAGSIAIRLDVEGDVPRDAWTVDVAVCMRGSVHYDAGL